MAVNRVPVLKRCRSLDLDPVFWDMVRSLKESLQELARR